MPRSRTVALTTLGCARNDVDSDELAGRLAADGWELIDEESRADLVLVNTCGFVEAAKKDSIDALLAAADLKESGQARAVVAVGCLAERYGDQLAAALPEADAVLSFDDYPDISARLRSILAGAPHRPHVPRDRRALLPIAPAARRPPSADQWHLGSNLSSQGAIDPPGFRANGTFIRLRRSGGPVAPLKIASGCDRRCTFCAIPRFRGSFISRPPADVLAEARWLAAQGVREVVLVSENSTSYGKDLGNIRLLEQLLPELAAIDGLEWIRVSYLQPAELRPGLIDVITATPGVVPYFDISFQHASGPVLRRMRRFGDTERFLELLSLIRQRRPDAGVRTNVIVGFPGETEQDVAELERFLTAARLDAVGVFGYSDEDGTEAASLPSKIDDSTIRERVERISSLVDELMAQRAEERVGKVVEVLTEVVYGGQAEGRSAHQAPEVDGSTTVYGLNGAKVGVGSFLRARVVEASGADLVTVLDPATAPNSDRHARAPHGSAR